MVVYGTAAFAAFPPLGGILKTPLGRFLAPCAYPAYSLIMDYISEIFVISKKEVRADDGILIFMYIGL